MFNKQLFLMSLKDDFNKTMKPISENASTLLMIGSIFAMGAGAYQMWKAVPKAQAAIEEKKTRDASLTKLEAAAVAAPYMALPVTCFAAAAGMMIGSDYISRSRLAAASTVIAGLTASNQKWQKKFEEYVGATKAKQAKKEIFEETTGAEVLEDEDDGDPTTYGTDQAGKLQRRKNALLLNKLTRCVFEDNREFWCTPMKLQEVENYIRMTYGPTEANKYVSKEFSLNDVTRLIGVDYGIYGDNNGFSDAGSFEIGKTPAYDSRTGELFLLVTLPPLDPQWHLPWKK